MLTNLLIALTIGLLAGTHVATWGMYKDAIHEGFTYRKYFRSVILSGVIAVIVALITDLDVMSQPLSHQEESLHDREVLIQRSIVQLRYEAFDSVLANSAALRERYPEDPIGYFIAADAYQTMMRNYRVRKFEAQFDSLIDLTVIRAKNALKNSPTAENYFILGAAEGYRCLHQFRRGERLKAVSAAVTCIKTLHLAIEVQPEFVDPLFGLALYEYGKSKVLGLRLGLRGNGRKDVIGKLALVQQEGDGRSLHDV